MHLPNPLILGNQHKFRAKFRHLENNLLVCNITHGFKVASKCLRTKIYGFWVKSDETLRKYIEIFSLNIFIKIFMNFQVKGFLKNLIKIFFSQSLNGDFEFFYQECNKL